MPTIEERLLAYSHELDAAADRADAARTSPATARAPLHHRSGMRGWQSVSIAAVTVALVGAGLWAISNRESPQTTTPATVPTTDTALPGEASPWYRISASGLVAQPVEQEACCATFDVPGPPTVVSWQAAGGPRDGLLVLTVFSQGEPVVTEIGADMTEVPQADGSIWQFWSYGMTAERREELAALVVPGSGLPYVLPDPSMSLLSIGGLGPAPHTRSQGYLDPEVPSTGFDFATISVGSDRGVFRRLAMSESLTDTTVAGMPAFRSEQPKGVVIFVWQATAGQWAELVVSGTLAARADEIAASVVPDQTELLPPGMAATSNGPTAESDATAQESLAMLTTLGWPVTLDGHETRTTAEGVQVRWASFSEPRRRLFVVSGPADLLSTVPDLQRQLTSTSEPGIEPAIWVWPKETWLTTEAVTMDDRTIIVRSEGIDRSQPARSRADMDALVQATIAATPP